MRKTYFDTNKEVFEAELYAMGDTMKIALQESRMGREASREQREPPRKKIHIWVDSQAAIRQLQHTDSGPEQRLARRIIGRSQQLMERGTEVEIYWVPGHMGVEGTEKANEAAKETAERVGTQRCLEQFFSFTHVS